jgi:light-regulated signal transduction histidine kinase (bacteriophytochrome)
LLEAKRIIEEQNLLIQQKNNELGIEVARQTRDLTETNLELIEQNTRLEQFAFIISHNLRAPMARIVGLSAILDFAKDSVETSEIVKLMAKSTQDLDQVIKDLTLILGIQKMNTKVLSEIPLASLLQKVLTSLEPEIKETKNKGYLRLQQAERCCFSPSLHRKHLLQSVEQCDKVQTSGPLSDNLCKVSPNRWLWLNNF